MAAVRIHSARIHGAVPQAAVTLAAGAYTTTWLPDLGMLGVSLTHDGDELLALPRTLADYRRGMPDGGYTGLPLNAPWANRLSEREFVLDGRPVRIGRRVAADRNGLPIHGTVQARPFGIDFAGSDGGAAVVRASLLHDDAVLLRAFPFAHRITIDVRLTARGLSVNTTAVPTARGAVPVAFGWHPFLTIPGVARERWRLRLPARRHHVLDDRLLPTGRTVAAPAEERLLGRRTFDDHSTLGADRRFALSGGGRRIDVRFDRGFGHAQLYVAPAAPGHASTDFACIEPMTAPVNALVAGGFARATRAAPYTARFTIACGRERLA